jgi:hypothetical protein
MIDLGAPASSLSLEKSTAVLSRVRLRRARELISGGS